MALVVSLAIYKGGTTKTTSSVNLAATLAKAGKRVLLVDLDKQTNATEYLGVDPHQISPNLFHVFRKETTLRSLLTKTPFGVDVIPGTPMIKAIEDALEPEDRGLFRELLEPLKGEYDFIFVDCPPGSVEITLGGVVASDLVLCPLVPEKVSVQKLSDLVKDIQGILWSDFQEELRNQEIRMFFARRRLGNKYHPSWIRATKKIYGDHVLDIVIPDGIDVPRSYDKATPLVYLLPEHPVTLAYTSLSEWLVDYAEAKTR